MGAKIFKTCKMPVAYISGNFCVASSAPHVPVFRRPNNASVFPDGENT